MNSQPSNLRQPGLSHRVAARTIHSAAERSGYPAAIAILDEGGALKAFTRMDGAPLLAVHIAQDKAYTAAGFGLATEEWSLMLARDRALAIGAPSAISRLVAIPGGLPIHLDGVLVGGIGVSGGSPREDANLAAAALREVMLFQGGEVGDGQQIPS